MFTLLLKVGKMLNSSKHMVRVILLTYSLLFCSLANALSLGDFTVESYLDEPLNAEIVIKANRGENLGSLNVVMASQADFDQAGIKRIKSLDNFQFKVITNSSSDGVISISSKNPVSDPYVHVLLKLTWSGGQILREFTALIDPPLYSSSQAAAVETSAINDYSDGQSDSNYYNQGNNYGSESGNLESIKVVSGSSLGSIAEKIQFTYTDLSVYQIMQALYRDNPEAFISNNMNGLINGSVLKVADPSDIRQFSKKEGINIFYSQLAAWNSINGISNSSYESSNSQSQNESAYSDSSLAVSAPSDSVSGSLSQSNDSPEFQVSSSAVSSDGVSGGVNADTVNSSNADLEASYESAKMENEELKNAIAMLEAQLADSGKLIELNNQELANIQSQASEVVQSALDDTNVVMSEEPVLDEESVNVISTEVESDIVDSTLESDSLITESAQQEADIEVSEPVVVGVPAPVAVEAPAPVVVETKKSPSLVDTLLSYVSQYWTYAAGLLALILGAGWFLGRSSDEDGDSFDDGFTIDAEDGDTVTLSEEDSKSAVENETTVTMESEAISSSIDMDALREATQSVSDFSEDGDSATETTKESSFLTVYNDGDIAANADEIDPIAEADVYIAYGREDQGEEVLLEGVNNFPNRLDIKSALLALYLKSKQRGKFDALYGELYSSDIDKTTDEWKAIDSLKYDMNMAVPEGSSSSMDSPTETKGATEASATAIIEEGSKLDFDVTVNSIVHELSEIDVHHEELSIDVSEIDFNNDDIAEIDDASISKLNADIISEEAASAVEELLSSTDPDTVASEIDFSGEVLTEEYSVDVEVDNSHTLTGSDTVDISMEIDVSSEMQSVSVEDTSIELNDEDSIIIEEFSIEDNGEISFIEDHSSSEELLLDLSEVDMDLSEISELSADDGEADELDAIDLNLGGIDTDLPDGTSDPKTQLDLAKVFIELDDVNGAVNILKGLTEDGLVGAEAKELLEKHS